MELVTAARKQLLRDTGIKNLVVDRVWKWRLEESLEGTGQTAIVLRNGGNWSKPGKNSQEYPILTVECYADHSRTPDGSYPVLDREDRVMQLIRAVDRIFHQVDREVRYWPEGDESGLLVLGSFRGTEPTDVVERHGVAVSRITYDVQVVH
jgi:hypothetical protein